MYTPNCFNDIESILKTVKERLNREVKTAAGGTSIEEMISQRRWTEGGLQELRRLLEAGWLYFDSLVALRQVS
jgi:hypothetical protein